LKSKTCLILVYPTSIKKKSIPANSLAISSKTMKSKAKAGVGCSFPTKNKNISKKKRGAWRRKRKNGIKTNNSLKTCSKTIQLCSQLRKSAKSSRIMWSSLFRRKIVISRQFLANNIFLQLAIWIRIPKHQTLVQRSRISGIIKGTITTPTTTH